MEHEISIITDNLGTWITENTERIAGAWILLAVSPPSVGFGGIGYAT